MRTKISFLLVTIVIIPIAILGYFSLLSQNEMVDTTLRSMDKGFSELIAYQVWRLISKSRTGLQWLATVPELARSTEKDPSWLVNEFLELHGEFEGIMLFDRAKRVVCQAGAPTEAGDLRFLFSNAVFDRYGGMAQKRSGEAGKLSTIQPQLKQPVYDRVGRLRGVIVASLNLESLKGTLENIVGKLSRTYEYLDIYVLDQYDRVMVANRGARFPEGSFFPLDVRPQPALKTPIRSFYPYETPDWWIVTLPRPQARISLNRMMGFLKKLTLWTLLGATVLGLLFAGTITYPLRELVESAVTISKGDLSQPVEVHSSDEIGELADKFDVMRVNLKKMQDSLRAKIGELETLYGMGRAISSTIDFRELLEIVLDMVVRTTHAHRASIMLLDEQADELRIQLAHGLPDDVISSTRVGLGERVSGHVLETGRPLLIADVEKSPNFSSLKDGKIAAGTMMSIPLIAKEKRLGVLNVSRAEPYTFKERDLQLMMAVANQAAMAIDNARLYMLAITDELTKLYIRRFFMQRLQEEMRRARRYRGLVSVMILDIDHFKNFNDTYGHQAGDEVLVAVSKVMQRCVRKVDIVSRLGGEEFAIICPEQAVDEAIVPAERIRRSIEEKELVLGASREKVRVTVSIGLADFPLDADSEHELIERADQALYGAKHGGRNRVMLFRQLAENEKAEGNEVS